MPYGWQKPVDLAAHLLVRFFFPPPPNKRIDRPGGGHACVPLPISLFLFKDSKQNYYEDDQNYSGLDHFLLDNIDKRVICLSII